MNLDYNFNYPSIEDLRNKAKKRMPRFAFEYLDGGCNEDVNLHKNTDEIRDIELKPQYLSKHTKSEMKTELFGHTYDAPFGVAPVGLQGLMWPNSAEILAKASFDHNVPFVLSTVTTSSIERIGELTEGQAWFQLYHPAKDSLRDELINRAAEAEYPVLVILSDVPTFGFRPRDIRNGLAMPPRMTLNNMIQVIGRPAWALQTLKHGIPTFDILKDHIPKGFDMNKLGQFMDETFSGRLNEEKIKPIRDMWKGKLVVKGIANELDAERALNLGVDGIIVSNHGGRQLDSGQSTIKVLPELVEKYGDKMKIMLDSGIRSGTDIARTMASGADFTFLGRTFMYGVGALGAKGGNHTMSVLKVQLQQIMEQLCCEKIEDFPNHLI